MQVVIQSSQALSKVILLTLLQSRNGANDNDMHEPLPYIAVPSCVQKLPMQLLPAAAAPPSHLTQGMLKLTCLHAEGA